MINTNFIHHYYLTEADLSINIFGKFKKIVSLITSINNMTRNGVGNRKRCCFLYCGDIFYILNQVEYRVFQVKLTKNSCITSESITEN